MPNIYVDTPDMKQGEQAKKKTIQLVYTVMCDNPSARLAKANASPCHFDTTRLLQKGDKGEFDIIQCYSKGSGVTYLGHWNDGVIE